MTPATAIRTCLRKYATFHGRATRPEYWWFILFLFLGNLAAGLLDQALFGTRLIETGPGEIAESSTGPLAGLFALGTLLPSLAAGWRRMHDSGRSGFYLLYPLIVIVGIVTFVGLIAGFQPLLAGDFGSVIAGGYAIIIGVALFVFFISPLIVLWWLTRPSTPGPNEYGPHPKEVTP